MNSVRNLFAKRVLMVSPTHFSSNSLTAIDNHFMKQITLSPEEVNQRVITHSPSGPAGIHRLQEPPLRSRSIG